VTVGRAVYNRDYIERAVELCVHIGLLILLAAACFLILRPFLPIISWGIIIAVAGYPAFQSVQTWFGNRGGLAAAAITILLLAIIIVPAALSGQGIVHATQGLMEKFKAGEPVLPPPAASVSSWPIIGAPLAKFWGLASRDLGDFARQFAPQIKAALPGVVSASAGISLAVLQLILSVLLAGGLLANAQSAYEMTRALANRLFGARGPEFQELVGRTIRSVVSGIVGVALIQTALAAAGFLLVGLPGASLWIAVFLFSAILQMGGLVLIPAVIYVFAVATTTRAVIFLVWCIVVGASDNVLKPIFLGRGVAVPTLVIFVGAFGGFIAMGIVGLFIGAVVLSVAYKLFVAWLEQPAAELPA
jgi:predicted PurR-regulated permease PerM